MEKSESYRRVETMLREYNSLQARLQVLRWDLQALLARSDIAETTDEAIAGAYFRRQMDGLPQGRGDVSDKTSRVALSWGAEHDCNVKEMSSWFEIDEQSLRFKINSVVSLLKKVDVAIEGLTKTEAAIIRGYYIDGHTWPEIANQIGYDSRHCRVYIRPRAIKKMAKSIFGGEQ